MAKSSLALEKTPFHLVGIGASAGGLEALEHFFANVPPQTGMAFGLGVGLTLVRAIVTMHDGEVSATSEGEGRGSTFVVKLPLTTPAATEGPARSRLALGLGPGSRVVVVEDNADSRETLCELLVDSGFECWSADTGSAGLALIRDVTPHAALVDVGLPEVDGYQLARSIRADPNLGRLPLIALTGYGQPSDRAEALQAGFDEHLVKPVTSEELLAILTEKRVAE